MISVKESLNQIETADRRFRAALESYTAAVESIDKHVLPLQPALEPEYRRRLKAIRAAISEKAPPAVMETARRQLDEALKGYCGKTADLWNERAEDIRQILLALAGATEALDRQSGGYGEHFRQIAHRGNKWAPTARKTEPWCLLRAAAEYPHGRWGGAGPDRRCRR
jgi:hypothetical protein